MSLSCQAYLTCTLNGLIYEKRRYPYILVALIWIRIPIILPDTDGHPGHADPDRIKFKAKKNSTYLLSSENC
jgi:hypothetical protein